MRKSTFFWILVLAPGLALAQPVIQPFTFDLVEHNLPMVRHGSLSWGDIDGDGDLDLFLSGESDSGIISDIYRNDGIDSSGNPRFSALQADIVGVVYSFSSWADFDGDSDLDLLVSGSRTLSHPYAAVTRLYRNDNGTFTDMNIVLPDLHSGSSSWGDLDGDGDLDLIMTGIRSSDDAVSIVAINQGGGHFDVATDVLPAMGYGDSALGDIDSDGDLDLVLSGNGESGFTTRWFRNDSGSFTAVDQELGPFVFSSLDLGDYDNDGDLDLVIGGGVISSRLMDGRVNVWNNSGGSFSAVDLDLIGVFAGDITWGDYDNDGDLDLLILGAENALGRRNARLYRNDGNDSFVNSSILIGSLFSDVEWGDIDGDGDLDLLSSGFTPYGQTVTSLYLNNRQVIPQIPSAPGALISSVDDRDVELTWAAASDADIANLYVSYNIRVGTAPGASDIVSAMSDPGSGRLLIPRSGNAIGNSMLLKNLEDGTYFWSVQAVNHALLASRFAAEGSFTISGAHSIDSETEDVLPRQFVVRANYPNPFSLRTTLEFDLPEPADVSFRIYSVLGQEVVTIAHGVLAAGPHRVEWAGRDGNGQRVGSGIYLFELRAGNSVKTGTMTLIR